MKKYRIIIVMWLYAIFATMLTTQADELELSSEIVSEIKYDCITDIDAMLQLGQRNASRSGDSQQNVQLEFSDEGNLSVYQLASETYYADGSYSKDYMLSTIELYEAGTQSIESKSYSVAWNKYDIAATATAYYTRYYQQSGYEDGTKITKLNFSYTKGGSTYSVSKVEMYSHGLHNTLLEEPIERYSTYYYPNPSTTYTLNTNDSRIYNSSSVCTFYLGAIVTLSDGTTSGTYDLMIMLEQIEGQW